MHRHIKGRIVSHHSLKLPTLQMYTWTRKITIYAERESVHHYHSSQSSLWYLDQACLTTLQWPLPPGNIEAMSDRGKLQCKSTVCDIDVWWRSLIFPSYSPLLWLFAHKLVELFVDLTFGECNVHETNHDARVLIYIFRRISLGSIHWKYRHTESTICVLCNQRLIKEHWTDTWMTMRWLTYSREM